MEGRAGRRPGGEEPQQPSSTRTHPSGAPGDGRGLEEPPYMPLFPPQ